MSEETAIGCERWTGKLRNFGSVQNSAKTLCDRGQILPLPEPQFPYLQAGEETVRFRTSVRDCGFPCRRVKCV